MSKYIVIDKRMRDFEKSYFVNNGFKILEIPENKNTYLEISSHVDIFCTKADDIIIFEKDAYDYFSSKFDFKKSDSIICGGSKVDTNYPYDVPYNICFIGNNAIHNFKYTDKKILDIIKEKGLNMININQGYSKCSIAVVDDNSCIVTDKSIYGILENNDIDVLLLENKPDIKLLNDNKYSDMSGFIGGAIARVKDSVVVFGDIKYTNNENEIRKFVENRNLKLVDFKEKDLIDYGGIIEFRGEDI